MFRRGLRPGAVTYSCLSGTYSCLSELDVQHFVSIVGAGNAITAPIELEPYNTDWMGKYRGQSTLALRPGSTQEVSRILAHCHARRLPLVPQGGNTGLVGGSVPIADEVVLSLSRMDRILSLDEMAGSLTCEAGCVLETLQQHVSTRGFTMPLDLGAKVCTVCAWRVHGVCARRVHGVCARRVHGVCMVSCLSASRCPGLVPDRWQPLHQCGRAALPAIRIPARLSAWAGGNPHPDQHLHPHPQLHPPPPPPPPPHPLLHLRLHPNLNTNPNFSA